MVIVFDIETLKLSDEVGGWKNFLNLGISCAVFYDSDSRNYDFFSEKGILEKDEISECSRVFERAIDENIPLLGHNIKKFDIPLIANEIGYKSLREDVDHLIIDTMGVLYNSLGFNVSLDNLAKYTLGSSKSMEATEAPIKWRGGNYQEVLDYCKNDVDLNYSIFKHGREKGYVKFKSKFENEPREMSVSW